MAGTSSCWLRISLTLCSALGGLAAGIPSASAAQTDAVSLELTHQRLWYTDGDDLNLRVRIDNDSDQALDGFSVRLLVYDRVASRTALKESFTERPEILRDGEDRFFLDRRVRPGDSGTVSLRLPLSTLDFSSDDESGVYPLEITLEGAPPEQPLASLMTQIVFYPHSPETPLNLVPVLPLSAVPGRGPDGQFREDPVTGRVDLEQAVSSRGWLTEMLNALEAHSHLRIGLAPTPRMIEELADMANGYTRISGDKRVQVRGGTGPARRARDALARLRSLLARRNVEPLLVPYAAPDLPTTAASSGLLRQRQWKEGADVLNEVLGVDLGTALDRTWLYPPGGRLDAGTLEVLQRDHAPPNGAVKTFFSSGSIEDVTNPAGPACPRALVTFACPVKVRTVEGTALGFLADAGLQDGLADLSREPGNRLLLQRIVSETAMIREEFPGLEGRVVHIATPPLWHPPARALELFLDALEAPWLKTRTPTAGLRTAAEISARRVVERADRLDAGPSGGYLDQVREASTMVESFSTIEPPTEAVERLRRDVLVAQSRLWWIDEPLAYIGEAFATEAESEARHYLDKIQLGGRGSITLTSQRQVIPLVLFNDNPFKVRVRVYLRSSSLDFSSGWERGRQIPVPPGNQPLTIQATARQSGEFPLEVRLTTPSDAPIAEDVVRIRSTEFNRIALAITFGALAFLVLFYAIRWFRQRREGTGSGVGGSSLA